MINRIIVRINGCDQRDEINKSQRQKNNRKKKKALIFFIKDIIYQNPWGEIAERVG